MDLTLFLQQIANGLSVGSVYAIFALGYTLIFSILGIINFAHGAVFTLGAYFTLFLMGAPVGFNGLLAQGRLPFALPFPLALLISAILSGLVSVGLDRVNFRLLRRRGSDPLLTLVSSLGLAVAIVNTIQLLVGAEAYSFPSSVLAGLPPAVQIPLGERPLVIRTVQIVIFVVSMIIVVLLTLLVNRTKVGKAMLAVAEDGTTANLLGINTDRIILITFFVSGFVAAIAGTLVGLSVTITGPYFGISFGLKGLAVIVLGGLGSIPGAVVGGLLIGIAESLVPAQYIGYKDAVAFLILFIILLVRPRGLLGRPLIQKV